MRKRISLTAALVGVLALGTAGAALADTSSHGKLVSYVHHKAAQDGTLVLKNAGGKHTYVVPDSATCGYQRGQSGGPLPGGCPSLGKKKYHGDKVNIRYTKKNGHDVASFVSVVETS
jgi:hypothetical protein